jgi:hypothetical protein
MAYLPMYSLTFAGTTQMEERRVILAFNIP